MTLLESRTLPLPIPTDFRHAKLQENDIWPAHWNDVRFNFQPGNIDRRIFIHDNMMNAYDIYHDFAHTTGFVDEDLDFELPDPGSAQHYKLKRSQVMHTLGIFVACGFLLFVPICGFKLPQKDNPFYWRKKFASSTTIGQMQKLAHMEYGNNVPKAPMNSSSMITSRGFTHSGNGLRYELDNYDDLVM